MQQYNCPKCSSKLLRNGFTPKGKVRWACIKRVANKNHYCYSTTNPVDNAVRGRTGVKAKSSKFKRKLTAQRYVVTSAQNATPVNEPFLKSLLTLCDHVNAELIVIPLRYKNPTSRWSASQANDESWDPALTPYLYNARKKLNPNLVLLGDIKTQPTAQSPLTGFEAVTHGESCILGHTKLQLRTVPTPQSRTPKILTTTGAVTLPNYTDSKAGKLGEFHHSQSACFVEVSGKTFHLRQITANKADGSFTEWDKCYYPDGTVKAAPPAIGLVVGDVHHRFIDPAVKRATWGPNGIIEQLDPKVVVYHDTLDGHSRNPHHKGNPFSELAKVANDMHIVEREVRETIEFLIENSNDRKTVIVSSNHDGFLRRWIVNTDWRADPANAKFYLETAMAMVNGTKMGPGGLECIDPFRYWVEQYKHPNIRCLAPDESFRLGKHEAGMHGHQGPNGARGSIKNLSRLGVKVISGHGHSPAIEEGHTRTGTSSILGLEYVGGPSSWLQTHSMVYADGNRTLINLINGEFQL